jgi:TonB-linked SusC/RagA family outer membrane protein
MRYKIPLKRAGAALVWFLISCVTLPLAAQNISLRARDITVLEVMERLQKDYGYSFSMEAGTVDVNRKVSISERNVDIRTVLDRIFGGEDVVYTIDGKIVSVTVAQKPQAREEQRQGPAERVITGTVSDASGPVAGASVVIKGTSTGTYADLGGRFSVKTSKANPVLVVSFMGLKTTEVEVGNRTLPLDIVMENDENVLDELVIVGYGAQRKGLITNAISQFKPGEDNARTALSPSELLQGRVAGVNVSTTSGNLGTAEKMSIRGSSSLSASNEPLYVVDGIPLNNVTGSLYSLGEDLSSLSVLNLTDIESIEVLKDAASAAIYGSRATNGVVLITTKQGREGRSEVKVNYSMGINQFPNRNRIRYADSASWIEVYNEGIDNYNRQMGYTRESQGYIQHIRNPFGNLPDTDWLGVITRLGQAHNADVSFTGGTSKTKVYLGANFAYQEGVIKTNDILKINLRANLSHKVTKWLEVGGNMSGNYLKNNRVPGASIGSTIIGRAVEQRPFDRPFKPSGAYFLGGTDELSRHNPVQILTEETSTVTNYRFLAALWAQASIVDGLKMRISFSTDDAYTFDYLYYNENHPYKEDNGRIIEKNRFFMSNLVEAFLTYDKTWGDLSLGTMAGHSFQKTSTRNNSIDAQNFPSPSFDTVGVAANIAGVSGGLSEYALESFFGRVNLSWKDRYILNTTIRADGSSRFPKGGRWGFFPSVSLGWNVAKEPFWHFKAADLKLRLSYGKTGNQDGISNYGYKPLIGGGFNYLGESGIAVSSKGNPDLSWEMADQYDFGFDFTLFKGKIEMIFDTYLKNTRNLLYDMPMHSTTGQTQKLANIGSMRNYGVEFTLNTHADLGPVHWASSFNITHNRNTLTSLLGNDIVSIGSNHALQVGKEVGSFYLLRFDGIYQYDGEVPDAEYDMGVRAGDIKYYDLNGDGLINDDDRIITGSPNPVISGGWSNTFSWKGLNLNVFFTYSQGAEIYATWLMGPTRMGNYQALLQEWCDNRWTGPGSTDKYPRSIYSFHGNNNRSSTKYLVDGSFIKVKSVTLSYTLPSKWTDAVRMRSVRVYVQGENLALISRYPGWDPEMSTSLDPQLFGVANYGVPSPRVYKAGVNITF